jgi:cytosine/adenosine deaminase-related metal-dependent hydrolase
MYKSQFSLTLDRYCEQFGGLFNAHTHVDRFATLLESMKAQGKDDNPLTSHSLWDKVTAIETLHRGTAYSRSSLMERIDRFLSESEACGIRRIDSFIDIDNDIELADGMGALEVALDLKQHYKNRLDFRIGAYVPSGFKKKDRKKLELFENAIKIADFIGTSPERDDSQYYPGTKDHIGLRHHFEWTLDLAISNNKPVHYHLDQQVSPLESGTEGLINLLESSSLGKHITKLGEHKPVVWIVHAISPSTYNRARLQKMIGKMAQLNIGLICCPSAAISMRKLPIFEAPISKSIAEVLPMLDSGIQTRLGTDNVDDIFLPANSLDLRQEVTTLANALRFYNVPLLAKLACGQNLSPEDRDFISRHLKNEENYLNEFTVARNYPL